MYDAVTATSYTTVESAGPLSVCIRVDSGTINQAFDVTLTTGIFASSASATGKLHDDILLY